MAASQEEIEKYLADKLWRVPGQHMLEIGPTGSGKTNGLYYHVDKLLHYSPNEKLVWFSPGKSAEEAVLSTFRPLQIHIPANCKMTIKEKPTNKFVCHDVKIEEWKTPRELWRHIDETPLDRINVISFERYVTRGSTYVNRLNAIFDSVKGGLLDCVEHNKIKTPMAVFMDEFQDIAPAKIYELSRGHFESGANIQFFMDRMRSQGLRLMGASQGWGRLRAGVRSQFQWNMARRGARYLRDSELSAFNKFFRRRLKPETCIIADPNNRFEPAELRLPFYGDGKDIWSIDYEGSLCRPKEHEPVHTEEPVNFDFEAEAGLDDQTSEQASI